MRKVFPLILMLALCLSAYSQKGKTVQSAKGKAKTTQTKKTTSSRKNAQKAAQKPATSISKLQEERRRVEQQRKATIKKRDELKQDVRKGMENLMVLDTEIAHQRSVIDTIRSDISTLDGYIALQDSQLVCLEGELEDRKMRYMKSMRYMHRNRSIQNQLAFVFSADNFNQMYRRLRFNREYAAFQKAQGEAVRAKQQQVVQKRQELSESKHQKNALLAQGEQARRHLEGRQTEQKAQVEKLKKEQKTVQALIEQQQRQEAELNARIDKLIAEEIAREKARQEALARKRAQEEAARRRQAEQARKRAAAEAARKESERRGMERKEGERPSQERKAKTTTPTAPERVASESRRESAPLALPRDNGRLSGSFEANRGRLPMPITGAYRLIRGFGTYSPEGLSRVQLQSNGWYLKGSPGARAQSIYNGVVSGVYYQGGSYIVTVRHGTYISVYINLSSVCVRTGQRVAAREALGQLGPDHTMHFQLRNWSSLLNPSKWIGR